ncbi:MAG: polysaccharide deacetylase family protein [Oscillospiraceae bacterium]
MRKFMLLFILIIIQIPLLVSADNSSISRKDACKMVTSILSMDLINSTTPSAAFNDTSDFHILIARELGISNGCGDNLFLPNDTITTQDFLIMLKRALDRAVPSIIYDNTKVQTYADDYNISEYAKYSVNQLSEVGVFSGTWLHPAKNITYDRAADFTEMAKGAIRHSVRSSPGVMTKKIPKAFMYHAIGTTENPAAKYLFVSPENFEAQIKYLSESGYTFLFPEEISYSNRCSNSIIITFDDGYENNYTKAMPILKKYNAKATVFVPTSLIGKPGYCTRDQLAEMSKSGVFRIYSHSVSHGDLTKLSAAQIETEMRESNAILFGITKREVTSFAYPYGRFNDTVYNLAKLYYKSAFRVGRSQYETPYNIFRSTADGNFSLDDFIKFSKLP